MINIIPMQISGNQISEMKTINDLINYIENASTLVVGATSDLATHYLNDKHDLKDFVLIARDKNKFKLKFSEKKIKDLESLIYQK